MTADALLSELRSQGIELQADGDRLLYRGRRALTPKLRDRLRIAKSELLDLLRQDKSGGCDPDALLAQAELLVLEARHDLRAVRMASGLLGGAELWVCLDTQALGELEAEEALRTEPRPVLLAQDILTLRGKPPELVRAALKVRAVFPGTPTEQ